MASSVANALALSPTNTQTSSSNNNSEIIVSATTPSSDFQGTINYHPKSFRIDTRLFSMEKLKAALNRVDSTDLIRVGGSDITQLLCEALIDASAKAVMQSLLSTSFLLQQIPATAIQAVRNEDLVQFLTLGATDSPLAVPRDAFTTGEWDSVPGFVDPITYKCDPFPFIRFADPHVDNPFLSTVFVSPDQVRNFFLDADQAFFKIAKWTLDAIKRSFSLGSRSVVNFGSPFLQQPSEYRQRIGWEYNPMAIIEAETPRGWEIVPHPIHSSLTNNPNSHLSLILHPLHSTAVLNGLIDPYDPHKPSFDTTQYTPSAYIMEINNADLEMMGLKKGTQGLKRKRGADSCEGRVVKRGRKSGGAL
ncbi:hypothetical protein PQX77_015330 [Marasmius sp. AFHP31]|nr:hypothetical protein PQX77_015330 [Marasmius sp. AFHP31]